MDDIQTARSLKDEVLCCAISLNFKQGYAHFNAGNYELALAKYQKIFLYVNHLDTAAHNSFRDMFVSLLCSLFQYFYRKKKEKYQRLKFSQTWSKIIAFLLSFICHRQLRQKISESLRT